MNWNLGRQNAAAGQEAQGGMAVSYQVGGGEPGYIAPEQALADLDQGMTPRQVAAKHGVHYQTINKLRRERGDRT